MTTSTQADAGSRPSADCHVTATGAEPGILGALLEALNGCGDYRIYNLGGELFLELRCQSPSPPQSRGIEF
jgi:hypothetical protein